MKNSGEKRKEIDRDESCSDEPACKAIRLSVEVDPEPPKSENIEQNSELDSEKPSNANVNELAAIPESTDEDIVSIPLPKHVIEWSKTHYQQMCRTFNIYSEISKTNIDTVMSEFSRVVPNDKYIEYINSLQESFALLNCSQVKQSDSEADTSGSSILSEDVLQDVIKNLRSSKDKLSSNQFSRFPSAFSFLNDLNILSKVTMSNVGTAHLKMIFHSLLQSVGLQVRSGCDYTAQEEIFDRKYTAEPDMRIYAENHTEYKEPKIMATVKVGHSSSRSGQEEESLPSMDLISQAVGELLLDFRQAQYTHELFAFVVEGTKVWLVRLRRKTKNDTDADRCRMMVDREYRWKNFMTSEKEISVSQPMDYLCKDDRDNLYQVLAKFASLAGYATDSISSSSSSRQRLYNK